jgi:hypothetical protein
MKKNIKKTNKKYLNIISKIENIRKKNNTNWMNILRIAFNYNPRKTAVVMSKIYKDDQKISELVKELI